MQIQRKAEHCVSPFHRFPVIIGNIRILYFSVLLKTPTNYLPDGQGISTNPYHWWLCFRALGKKPTMMRGSVLI